VDGAKLNTLVVIPAFNESEVVATVIREVLEHTDFDVLVVDDGSSDNTAEVASQAGAQVARLPFNLGVGGAMRTGFVFAVENGYRNVVQVDADGQHNPSDLHALVAALDGADLVLGARFAGVGSYDVTGPRKWAMRLFAAVLSKTCKTRLTDTTSGFKASGPRAVKLFSVNYPAEYLGDTIEALVIAARAGLTITQVPVSMRERQGGTPSHNPIKSAIYLGRATVALCFALMRPSAS
jgi:glycosyltransferase involved in cell wall biosynthesis